IRNDTMAFPARTLAQSTLMLAARISVLQVSVYSTTSLANSAGELAHTVLPTSASRAFILGSAGAALVSLFSLAMISAGVSLGAPSPHHAVASKPGTISAIVGTSGSPSHLAVDVTASGRSFPGVGAPVSSPRIHAPQISTNQCFTAKSYR